MNKLISLSEAVNLVKPGSTLALGGMTLYRRPTAFVYGLLKKHQLHQEPSELTLLTFTAGFESDLLVGARMISKVRTCYFGLEIFGFAPMFSYYSAQGGIEIIEETEASLSFGLRAEAATVGFMPGRGWLGTDLLKLRPDVRTIIDPYNGEELVAFPAIRADIAVIHALQADLDGNALIGDNKGVDEELAITSGKVVVTAEEVLPELAKADLAAPFVDAVVLCPGGAAPSSCHPLYPVDGKALLDYTEQVSDPPSFEIFLDKIMTKI